MQRIALLMLLTGSSLTACAGRSHWTRFEPGAAPSVEDPDTEVVVLLDEQRLRFALDDEAPVARVETHAIFHVVKPSGAWRAMPVVYYSASFSELVRLEARIWPPDGEPRTWTLDDASDVPATEGVLYQDQRRARIDLGELAAGTRVEWRSELRRRSPELFIYRFGFGGTSPVERARFEVVTPPGWDIRHVVTRGWTEHAQAPEQEDGPEGRRWVWSQGPLAPMKTVDLGPSVADRAPIVTVRLDAWRVGEAEHRGFADLEAYGRWMQTLQAGTDTPTPEIEAEVARVLAEAPADPRARAARLYDWVQSNVRYVAIEVGLGGWRPHTAAEVFEARYGDCKDKANLLRTMLKVAGIDSSMTSLYAHDGVPRRFVLPGLGNSNHAILAVHLGDETVIADPTTRSVPFGELPASDREAEVLVLRADRPERVTTAAAAPEQNRRHRRVRLRLAADGSARGTVDVELHGDFASTHRHEHAVYSERRRRESRRRWALLPTAVVESSTTTDDGRRVRVASTVRVPRVGSHSARRRVIRSADLLPDPAPVIDEDRPSDQPVVLPRAALGELELELELPDGVRTQALPEPLVVEEALGRYTLRWSAPAPGRLRLERSYALRERIVPPDRRAELDRFVTAIHEAETRAVVLAEGGSR